MRIKLHNFRCHANKEVQFEEEGLTLLQGKTGDGKSTILEAIYFALYGEVRKPYTFGTSTCKVELEMYNMEITRTCRPNRLLVVHEGKEYEDVEAQHLINHHVMNNHEFLASSYIKQHSKSSLIAMTPTEQVNFIKKIALDTNVNLSIKNRIKDMIRETHDDLTKEKKNVEFAEGQISELMDDDTMVSFEIQSPPIDDVPAFQKEFTQTKEKIQKLKERKKTLQEETDEMEESFLTHKELIERKNLLTMEINQIIDKISEKGKIPGEEQLEKLENSLDELREKRSKFYEYDFYIEESQKFDEECQDYFDDQKEKLSHLRKKLLKATDYQKLVKQQKDYVVYENAKAQVDEIEEQFRKEFPKVKFERVSDMLDYLRSKGSLKVYTCPMCSTHLCVENEKLKETSSKSRTGKSDYDEWIAVLEKCIGAIEYEKEDQQRKLDEHLVAKNEIEKLEEIIQNNVLPKHLVEKERFVNSLEMDEPKDDYELLDAKIKKQETYLEAQWQAKTEIKNLENVISKKKKNLDNISDDIPLDKDQLDKLQKELKVLTNELEDALTKMDDLNKQKYALTQYKSYINHMENVEKWKKKKQKFENDVSNTEKRYSALLTLREKSNQAEVLALDSIINTINEHAKEYLDMMFPDDPIVVRVENYKETKNDIKCKMNTFIQYKGAEYDSVDQLSGGERQKCELAFELAVNALLNSKIMMLDECINNLDSEINTEILEILSQYAKEYGKLIVVVSHECVTGLFDHVYKVK